MTSKLSTRILPAMALCVLLTTLSLKAQDVGVLCRFNGQIDPDQTLELWNQRWDSGTGVTEVNNDCEAIVYVGSEGDREWVGDQLPSTPSYLRSRVEVGIDQGFVFPPEGFPIFEVRGRDLIGDQAVPYLLRLVLGRSDEDPTQLELLARWADDRGQYSKTLGPYEETEDFRLQVRLDWYSSTDDDKDYVPEPDGLLRLWINEEMVVESTNLLIDAISPTEVRFGHLPSGGQGAEGVFYFKPLGVHIGFHDAWED